MLILARKQKMSTDISFNISVKCVTSTTHGGRGHKNREKSNEASRWRFIILSSCYLFVLRKQKHLHLMESNALKGLALQNMSKHYGAKFSRWRDCN